MCLCVSSEGAVRLVSNFSHDNNPEPSSFGRLEIYHSETWGTVCDSVNYFNQLDANLVCGQLGYDQAMRHGTVETLQ